MKVNELIEALQKLEQDSEIRIHLVKDGWRPFTTMKKIQSIEPVFEQDTGELLYTITVDIGE